MKSCSNLITRASMWATLPLIVKYRGGSCSPLPSYSTNMRVVSSTADPFFFCPHTTMSATRFSVVSRCTKCSSCSFCSFSFATSNARFASSDHLCSYCHISAPPPATSAKTETILINCAFIQLLLSAIFLSRREISKDASKSAFFSDTPGANDLDRTSRFGTDGRRYTSQQQPFYLRVATS